MTDRDHIPSRDEDRVRGPEDGHRLTRYLLGQLAPEEAEAVEGEYFGDGADPAALEAAEDDLVDAFVRGRLGPEDLQAFEARYAASPGLGQRVAFARALLRVADQHRAPAPAHWRRRLTWVAVAAGLAAGVAAFWFASDRETRRDTEPPRIASFVLTEGAARDLMGTVLSVPQDAAVVRLELLLAGTPPPSPLDAVLQAEDGREVWRAGGLEVRSNAQGGAVTLTMGAAVLAPGEYTAVLSRPGGDGDRQQIAAFAFRAER